MTKEGRQVRRIKVAVVSPSDVEAERDVAEEVVESLRGEPAFSSRSDIKLWRWEKDAVRGMHRDGPQGGIDERMDIEDADFVIGIFWQRFGTPVLGSGSGTEHELSRALAAWDVRGRPNVTAYFCSRPAPPSATPDPEQQRLVCAYREKLRATNMHVGDFHDLVEFKDQVFWDLRNRIWDLLEGTSRSASDLTRGQILATILPDDDALFAANADKVLLIESPGGTLGRGEKADLEIVGSATANIGKKHLSIEPLEGGWAVRDLGSPNQTYEAVEDGTWKPLRPEEPLPLTKSTELCLGRELRLRLDIIAAADRRGVTPEIEGGPMASLRVEPLELERLAAELLAGRHRVPAETSVPSVKELAETLHLRKREVKVQLKALAALPDVAHLLRGRDRPSLPDALELAFPYLKAMSVHRRDTATGQA